MSRHCLVSIKTEELGPDLLWKNFRMLLNEGNYDRFVVILQVFLKCFIFFFFFESIMKVRHASQVDIVFNTRLASRSSLQCLIQCRCTPRSTLAFHEHPWTRMSPSELDASPRMQDKGTKGILIHRTSRTCIP